MKVLQVNCVYNKGSTGKIVYDIHSELKKQGVDSVVCYGRGEKVNEQNVYKTCGEVYSKLNNLLSRFTGIMYGGCFFSTNKLLLIIKKESPDIVHLHCLNGYFVNIYRLIRWLKKNNIKTVLTLHAEFMYTANCGHAFDCEKWKNGCGNCHRYRKETKSLFFDGTHRSWLKMKKSFENFDNLAVVSVSPWLMERAKQSPILADKQHVVVGNGINTDIFHFYDTELLKKQLGIDKEEKIIFHVAPSFSSDINHIKGGYYVLELAKQMPEVRFIIAGNVNENVNSPKNMILLGKVSDQKLLAQYYSMADITLLASKKETFSMVVAESLCCGTPIVGFNAGAPEQIAIKEYSRFVEYGDVNSLQEAVNEILSKDLDKTMVANTSCKKYSKENMCEEYLKIYV